MSIYDIYGNVIYQADSVDNLYTDNPSFYRFSTDSGTMQGGCTDGTYIYYIVTSSNKLVKLNIATGEKTTLTYTSGLYGHGNDMAYNPITNKIYIVTMESGAIRIVNPSTLEDEGYITPLDGNGNTVYSSGLAYDRKNNRYIVTNNKYYYIFDASWNYIKSFEYELEPRWTYQGVETDGVYVFRPVWVSGTSECGIFILDMEGNYQKQIALPAVESNEIETLANDWDGVWYAIYNGSPAVYLMGLAKYTNYHGTEITYSIMTQ